MISSLKIFVDVISEKSFSRAASLNYLTPSAVSQRIKALEEELGRPLVVRNHGKAYPTEAGRIFYEACREIFDVYSEALQQLDKLDGRVTGTVRVGTIPSVGLHELPPYIKLFLKGFPDADLNLIYLTNKEILQRLIDGELDLGIVAYPPLKSQFNVIPLRTDRLVVIAPRNHPLAARKGVSAGELDGQKFIGFDIGIPTEKAITSMLHSQNVEPDVIHRFDNIEIVKRAVEVGSGIAIVPEKTVEQELSDGNLASIALRGKKWDRPIALVHPKGTTPGRTATEFINVLLEYGAG